MRQHLEKMTVTTRPRVLVNITPEVQAAVQAARIRAGLVTIFVRHTSASLIIQESEDSSVRAAFFQLLETMAPSEGGEVSANPGVEIPAHMRTILTNTSVGVPILGGAMALGPWQAVFLCEHRTAPQQRTVLIHVIGE